MTDRFYPYKKYNYAVTIDQKKMAGFSEVCAPGITMDPVEYRESGAIGKKPDKRPGILRYTNVTFKRGQTESTAFVNWMHEIQNGIATRKTVMVALLDDEGQEAAIWKLEKAWPTKCCAPDFNASSQEVAIESLELVCEGITRICT